MDALATAALVRRDVSSLSPNPLDADGLCPTCRREWRAALGRPRCRTCGLVLAGDPAAGAGGAACVGRRSRFEHVIAAVDLDPAPCALIHRLKHRQDFSVVPLLQAMLVEAVAWQVQADRPYVLVPMPLHATQRRRRGFQPGVAVGRGISPRDRRALAAPWGATVAECRLVDQTVGPCPSGRAAWCLCRRRAIPERVAIVDDVLTADASAEALAKALQRGGVSAASVWTLARTP